MGNDFRNISELGVLDTEYAAIILIQDHVLTWIDRR